MEPLRALETTIRQQQNRYYGKYRGFVTDNKDPEKRGRLKLTVPSVLADAQSSWALPCLAYGGAKDVGAVAVPPVDAQVVVEFLEGDLSAPMWTGTFWRASGEPPAEFSAGDEPSAKVMKTEAGHLLVLEDKQDEEAILVKSKAEAQVELDPKGSVKLTDSGGATATLDAEAGEVKIEDANGNSMVLSSSGITLTDSAGNEVATSSSGVSVKGASMVTVEGPSVVVGGSGGEPLIKGSTFLAMFNAHTHVCTAPGAPSGPPVPPLTPAALTMKTMAS